MHLLLLFLIGGLTGLISSALRIGGGPFRPHVDVALGVVGSLFGGLLLARRIAGENVATGNYGVAALAFAALSACLILSGLNLFRKA
jgi:uncharacterized membrane protein YeaQ/YmgE (transglycosylase-associated protein family)